jgi:ribosomal protein S12 methylthiotransferase
MVDTMARHEQLLPYLDMPIQHADKDVLRGMGRPSDVDMTRRLVAHARAQLPEVAMRTTFIVGHPGETEEQFERLVDFVEELQFDHVGVFTYSHEPGTKSALLDNPVPPELAEERRARLMEAQQRISLAKNQSFMGRTLEVLIEGQGELEDDAGHSEPISVGRARRHAPEVDGLVFVPGALPVGELVEVVVEDAGPYDLWANPPGAAAPARQRRRAERLAARRARRNHSIRPDQAGRLGGRRTRATRVLTLTPAKQAET